AFARSSPARSSPTAFAACRWSSMRPRRPTRSRGRETSLGEPTTCVVAGEELLLLPERAAYWPAKRALFVADYHLGKAASFRSAGIPLPAGTTSETVE